MITNSNLHFQLIKGIIDHGFAPTVDELAEIFKSDKEQVIEGLRQLQEYHGVVLHPNEPKVWVLHPFSLAPTNFFVESKKRAVVGKLRLVFLRNCRASWRRCKNHHHLRS
jgi:hypothetical protein